MPQLIIDNESVEISLEHCGRCMTLAETLEDDDDRENAVIPLPSPNCSVRSVRAVVDFLCNPPRRIKVKRIRLARNFDPEHVALTMETARTGNYLGCWQYVEHWAQWASEAADGLEPHEFRAMLGVERELTGAEIRELQRNFAWI